MAGIGEWREVFDVPRHDVPRPARPCCRDLHCVLEVGHLKRNRITERRGVPGRNRHEPGEFGDEVACVRIPASGRHEVVEVRQGVPRDERAAHTALYPIKELGRWSRMRVAIEGDVDQHVRVEQDHKYLRDSAR